MNKIIFSLFDLEKTGYNLAKQLEIEEGTFELRNFPDGETYIRIDSNVQNKHVVLFCPLDHPDNKILLLYLLANTLKELGAKKITLVAPYLPYMRQDKRFKPGEAVSSHLFAQLISTICDSLITIDPHLHRIKKLSEIFSISTTVLHAALPVSEWIKTNVKLPFIIGPDEESAQWGIETAKLLDAPYIVANKKRLSDKHVIIDLPEIPDKNHTPVIVDDIISSGTTVRVVIEHLVKHQFKNPICIGIHGLFTKNGYDELIHAGAKVIVTCNTIFHPSNQINIFNLLLEGIKQSFLV